jgi:hypothetical protein
MAIYVLCPDENTPSGGVKKLCQCAEHLQVLGYEAYLLHHSPKFKISWFDHNAKTAYLQVSTSFKLFCYITNNKRRHPLVHGNYSLLSGASHYLRPDNDILIVPEIYGPDFSDIAPGVPKVIFNQNAYYTFYYDGEKNHTWFNQINNRDVISIVTVSDDSQKILTQLYPQIPVMRVHNAINKDIFFALMKI